ncbi:MAG: histidine kinase dimerization/phosphoacceptor domain -containing protein [Candidatus Nanopelagicales bacterium]
MGKDATIREIHHRVKNNLQTVAAMLRLQARRAPTEQAREALAEAELRVAAIAVVHDSRPGRTARRSTSMKSLIASSPWCATWRRRSPTGCPCRGSCATGRGDRSPRTSRRRWRWSPRSSCTTPSSHAAAASIDLCLEEDDAGLVLRVLDDGRGLPDGSTRPTPAWD